MKFTSPVYSAASGSVAGLTYSHNRGGMYTRSRAVPTDPGTMLQLPVRAILSDLANHWVNTLTPAQRNAWDTYSANVPLIGPMGSPRPIGGIAMYIRSNVGRIQAGVNRIDTAPVIWDLGSFTPPAVTWTAPSSASVAFTIADSWNVVGGHLLLYQGRPQNQTINFFKGPWRFMGRIPGVGVSPAAIATTPFIMAANQKVWMMVRAIQADGRLSYPTNVVDIV